MGGYVSESLFLAGTPINCGMRYMTTSCLVTMVVAASSIAAEKVGVGPSFKGPVGLQLYSLRAEFTRNVPATVEKVRDYGFKIVETAGTYNLTPAKFRELLDKDALKAVSGHFPFERLRDDAEGVAKDAKTLGLEYVGCAWVPHDGEFDEKECRNAIDVFNKAGEALRKRNLKLFYHAHGYEFAPFGNGTFMDLMMRETKPENVRFEMDIFWVVHPGHDPVKWFEKYPRRWELVHLKDMKKGVKTGEFTGKTDVSNDVALGTGQMDWPAILRAAKKAGVKYYFIEDESPTVTEQIPQSLKYLEQARF
jgi:sugar phosphate isomerase/epimerase